MHAFCLCECLQADIEKQLDLHMYAVESWGNLQISDLRILPSRYDIHN